MSKNDFSQFYKLSKDLSKYGDEVQAEVVEKVKQITLRTEADAKSNAPVDSGRLRNSIQSVIKTDSSGVSGEVIVNAEYGAFVEYGTSKQKAQPFLTPAFNKNQNIFLNELLKTLKR